MKSFEERQTLALESIATSLARFASLIPGPAVAHEEQLAQIKRLLEDRLGRQEPRADQTPSRKTYTTEEAAKETGCSAYTLRQRCNLGAIPEAVKVGKGWRIPAEVVERIKIEGLPMVPQKRACA